MKLTCKMGFGCNMKRDKQLCEYCLSQLSAHSEIPLRYQQILLKSNISRFSLLIADNISLSEVRNTNTNLDKCFKIQFDRICANQETFLPPTQLIIDDELKSISNIVKPLHHLFIYTNVPRSMNNLDLIHCNIWILLDYPNSSLDCNFMKPNIVAISLLGKNETNLHPLSSCFTDARRETLQQLLNRLLIDVSPYKPKIHSLKPLSTFFGFE